MGADPVGRVRRALLCAVLPLLAAVPALGQEEPASPVTDPRANYVVGFAELSAVDLPAEYRYLASSLPRLIVESFGADSGATHRYADNERDGYASGLVERQADLAVRGLSSAVRQRDGLIFERNATEEQRARADENVDKARALLERLESMAPSEVDIAREKPLVFWSGRAVGRLLAPVPVDESYAPLEGALEKIAADADLDLLIWGTVEDIRGYLKVDFYAYSPHSAEVRLPSAGTVALPSDIGQEAEVIAAEIATTMLGRPWGSVVVRTDINDAAVLVNGELVGYRQAQARFLTPGDVTVEVNATGYEVFRQTIPLADRETREIVVALEPLVNRMIRIESAPAGADVYVDSVWTGRTPLRVRAPDAPQIVRLRHEGYLESRFVLRHDSPDRVARAMLPDSLSWAEEIDTKRREFYRSLTWFVVSIPVTLVLNGAYQSVLSAFPSQDVIDSLPPEDLPALEAFAKRGNIFYWAAGGGLMVNIGLLVNVGINLFEYLEVGEGAHNQ